MTEFEPPTAEVTRSQTYMIYVRVYYCAGARNITFTDHCLPPSDFLYKKIIITVL